jgi:hypothetical protein
MQWRLNGAEPPTPQDCRTNPTSTVMRKKQHMSLGLIQSAPTVLGVGDNLL